MAPQQSLTRGDRVRQLGRALIVTPGTLMQKPIPLRLVEPYLTGRRSVIAGFVYRAQDSSFTDPAIPVGFAPFGIQDIAGQVYVTFASTTGGAGGYFATGKTETVLGPVRGAFQCVSATARIFQRA